MYRFLFLGAFMLLAGGLNLSAAATDTTKASTGAKTATLYYHTNCPHCHHVLDYLNRVQKTISIKNTAEPANRAEFNKLGQKGVPVLVVGSQVISGSDAIISYLKSHPEVMQ